MQAWRGSRTKTGRQPGPHLQVSYRDVAFPAPTKGASPVRTEVTPSLFPHPVGRVQRAGCMDRVPAVFASELHESVPPSEGVVCTRPTLCNKIVFILREAIFYYEIKYIFYIL